MGEIAVDVVCPICHEASQVVVHELEYIAWKSGMMIQDAMPHLTADQREQLITGIDKKCWDKLFSEEEGNRA